MKNKVLSVFVCVHGFSVVLTYVRICTSKNPHNVYMYLDVCKILQHLNCAHLFTNYIIRISEKVFDISFVWLNISTYYHKISVGYIGNA